MYHVPQQSTTQIALGGSDLSMLQLWKGCAESGKENAVSQVRQEIGSDLVARTREEKA